MTLLRIKFLSGAIKRAGCFALRRPSEKAAAKIASEREPEEAAISDLKQCLFSGRPT